MDGRPVTSGESGPRLTPSRGGMRPADAESLQKSQLNLAAALLDAAAKGARLTEGQRAEVSDPRAPPRRRQRAVPLRRRHAPRAAAWPPHARRTTRPCASAAFPASHARCSCLPAVCTAASGDGALWA